MWKFKRATLDLAGSGSVKVGSFIWRDEDPDTSSRCPSGHTAPAESCACGFHATSRSLALAYPGAGLLPLITGRPAGRVIVTGAAIRCERLDVANVSFPALCAWCEARSAVIWLRPVVAGPRTILFSACAAHRNAQSLSLAQAATRVGCPVDLLSAAASSVALDGFRRDAPGCPARPAWWAMSALLSDRMDSR